MTNKNIMAVAALSNALALDRLIEAIRGTEVERAKTDKCWVDEMFEGESNGVEGGKEPVKAEGTNGQGVPRPVKEK